MGQPAQINLNSKGFQSLRAAGGAMTTGQTPKMHGDGASSSGHNGGTIGKNYSLKQGK